MDVRGRVGRVGAVGALVVALAGVAAACADGEFIVGRSPERVAVSALATDPATYDRRSVIVRGATAQTSTTRRARWCSRPATCS